jgi:3-hydroxyisobutyrate dehydrogenase-like beta-hydroxyacid dehydrogenase
MGGRLAGKFLDQGHPVSGWNRTSGRATELVERGMEELESPAEVVGTCDVVFSMVTNTAAVEEIIGGEHGVLAGMRPGVVVVEMSTIDPGVSRRLAHEVESAGGRMLDCPVSGGVPAAEAGELSVMVGGDPDALDRVRPLFDVFARKVTHIGGNGQGLLTKLAINVSLCIQMIAVSEGILLAEKGGVRRDVAVQAFVDSAVASPMVKQRAPAVLPGALPDPPWFNCDMMQKDIDLAVSMARQLATPMLTSSLASELLSACRGSGLGHEDFTVVFHLLAGIAGVEAELGRQTP